MDRTEVRKALEATWRRLLENHACPEGVKQVARRYLGLADGQ